jgi:hypothetical protein
MAAAAHRKWTGVSRAINSVEETRRIKRKFADRALVPEAVLAGRIVHLCHIDPKPLFDSGMTVSLPIGDIASQIH